MWQDLRYGVRALLKEPGFAAVAIFTLALGIGANTAIFSVVYAVLLRPLPYPQPDRLMSAKDALPTVGFPRAGLTEAEFLRLREESRSFERLAFYQDESLTLTGAAEPERVAAGIATADLFALLGMGPAAGRDFRTEEEVAGQNQVVILSQSFRERRFDSNQRALGQTLTLNGRPYTVVGVLPSNFRSPAEVQSGARLELWIPPRYNPASPNRGSHGLNVVGRLRPGVTPDQAQAETRTIIGRVIQDNPTFYPADGSFRTFLNPLHEEIVGDVRPALLTLLGAVGFVLLIACANVANLLLARAEARSKEVAVRAALGAGRGRIVGQLLVESLLLALIGGSLGLLLAAWALDLLVAVGPENIPRLKEIRLDYRILGFTLGVSVLTGIAFGLAPAWQAAKVDLNSALKEGGRSSSASAGGHRLRQALVVTEVALSLLLLVGAGLLVRSFWRLQQVRPGFQVGHLLTMRLYPPAATYPESAQVVPFYERLLERVRALPGVEAVAAAGTLPVSGSNHDTMMEIEGRPFDLAGLNLSTDFRVVTPGYLSALKVPLVRGRFLTDADREGATRAVVVNETLARNHWPNEDPLGRRVRLLDAPPAQATTPWMTIVGVAGDAKNRGVSEATRQEMYVPQQQHAGSLGGMGLLRQMSLVVRTSVEPLGVANAVRQEVWGLDRGVPITGVRTMEQILATAVVQPRFNMILLAGFAALALLLAAAGIYGVMSYAVTRRTHEIGVRVSLGARPRDVLALVVGQGMRLAALGIAIGLAASFALSRLLVSLLYGVSATDPLTFGAVALLLAGVALAACWMPARRATRVDPLVALRYE